MTTAHDVVDVVTGVCEELFSAIDELRELVESQLTRSAVRRSDLAIESYCHGLLVDPGLKIAGAGLVIAPGVLEDTRYWLEWWTSDPDAVLTSPKRLAAETDPRAIGFRDYTQLPWYTTPFETGERHITGPYVDYLCTDQHTLTFTRPVQRGGEFAGVVGVDLLVRTLEEKTFAAVSGVFQSCAVINRAGRVVTASDPALVTGDLIRGLPVDAWWAGQAAAHPRWQFHSCPGLPLGVVQLKRAQVGVRGARGGSEPGHRVGR